MPFTDEVRAELAALPIERPCCRVAFLAAVARAVGAVHLHGGGRVHVELDLGLNVTARRVVRVLRDGGASCEIRTYQAHRFGQDTRFRIVLGEDDATRAMLVEAGVLGRSGAPLGELPARVVRRACCRVAYLRGALVAAGSVSGPGRDAHLELRAHERHAAETIVRLAAREGIALAVRERPDHAAAYAKRHETIADLLALLGAGEGALVLAEADVVARKREVANRQTNAETANLRRQVAAAGAQLDAIAALRAAGALEGLPAALLVAAALREEHREATLGELAALAAPPLARPTLAARLRRLVALADEL